MSTAMAGCSTVVDIIGDQILEDVNIFNQLNRDVSGSIEVTAPDGDSALDESFSLPPVEADGESNTVTYSDVWTDSGEYEVEIELTNTEIESTSQASESIRITDTDEQMAAIALGGPDIDEPIAIRVGKEMTDFSQEE
ncbi:hypothetical protein [Halorientalis litorea]|jgi:hypothetical protein|uniref:hypothetical protein n=1 Tax=Halorientalis litorea TaxID=2931977 RepID=UPI001FF1995D|nr:hypothetical protein [Halorientalis litorea]